MQEITCLKAINEAFHEEMQRDNTIYVIGTDVGRLGGTLGMHQGLLERFGSERVLDAPIAETAIIGSAIGAAATGMRPVPNISFIDFTTCCMDELINQLAKMRYMFGGNIKLPVTVTTTIGGGLSAGSQHSQSLEALFMHIPGLQVIVPSTPYDCKGLLKTAIRDENPAIFMVHKKVLGLKGEVPGEEYTIPLGKADIKRMGKDVTVVATAFMVHVALEAAARLERKGVSLEVVDPRTLVPLDKQTILESVKKTGRLVVCTEENRTGAVSAEIAALAADECFDFLDAPIKRVNAPDTPCPFSPVLENFYLPKADNIVKAIEDILNLSGGEFESDTKVTSTAIPKTDIWGSFKEAL